MAEVFKKKNCNLPECDKKTIASSLEFLRESIIELKKSCYPIIKTDCEKKDEQLGLSKYETSVKQKSFKDSKNIYNIKNYGKILFDDKGFTRIQEYEKEEKKKDSKVDMNNLNSEQLASLKFKLLNNLKKEKSKLKIGVFDESKKENKCFKNVNSKVYSKTNELARGHSHQRLSHAVPKSAPSSHTYLSNTNNNIKNVPSYITTNTCKNVDSNNEPNMVSSISTNKRCVSNTNRPRKLENKVTKYKTNTNIPPRTTHIKMNLAGIPFITGKSTTKSHSLSANLQEVLYLMKHKNTKTLHTKSFTSTCQRSCLCSKHLLPHEINNKNQLRYNNKKQQNKKNSNEPLQNKINNRPQQNTINNKPQQQSLREITTNRALSSCDDEEEKEEDTILNGKDDKDGGAMFGDDDDAEYEEYQDGLYKDYASNRGDLDRGDAHNDDDEEEEDDHMLEELLNVWLEELYNLKQRHDNLVGIEGYEKKVKNLLLKMDVKRKEIKRVTQFLHEQQVESMTKDKRETRRSSVEDMNGRVNKASIPSKVTSYSENKQCLPSKYHSASQHKQYPKNPSNFQNQCSHSSQKPTQQCSHPTNKQHTQQYNLQQCITQATKTALTAKQKYIQLLNDLKQIQNSLKF